jgi:hypothetical protein
LNRLFPTVAALAPAAGRYGERRHWGNTNGVLPLAKHAYEYHGTGSKVKQKKPTFKRMNLNFHARARFGFVKAIFPFIS